MKHGYEIHISSMLHNGKQNHLILIITVVYKDGIPPQTFAYLHA